MTLREQCDTGIRDWCTSELTWAVRACSRSERFKLGEFPGQKKASTPKVSTLTKSYLQQIPSCQHEVSFLWWILIGYIYHTPEQALCPEEVDQHKTNCIFLLLFLSMVVVCVFLVLFWGCFCYFIGHTCLLWVLYFFGYYFDFCLSDFFEREKEHKIR